MPGVRATCVMRTAARKTTTGSGRRIKEGLLDYNRGLDKDALLGTWDDHIREMQQMQGHPNAPQLWVWPEFPNVPFTIIAAIAEMLRQRAEIVEQRDIAKSRGHSFNPMRQGVLQLGGQRRVKKRQCKKVCKCKGKH